MLSTCGIKLLKKKIYESIFKFILVLTSRSICSNGQVSTQAEDMF